jgi:tetratricopeptide (TPR) repeat protein
LKAREFEPTNTSLAKEASLTAAHLGMHEMAARIADEAIETNRSDPALWVNAGLSHILSGNGKIALERFNEAYRIEPHSTLNKKLELFAMKVCAGQLPTPQSEKDIIAFVNKV